MNENDKNVMQSWNEIDIFLLNSQIKTQASIQSFSTQSCWNQSLCHETKKGKEKKRSLSS